MMSAGLRNIPKRIVACPTVSLRCSLIAGCRPLRKRDGL